jgi:hypothetical protein
MPEVENFRTAARAGIPVPAQLFCRPCLAKGHQCPAREGSDECIFCEDSVPCPITKRAVDPALRDHKLHAPVLVNDVLRRGHEKERPFTACANPEVPENSAKPKREESVVKEEAKVRICSVEGCGRNLLPNNTTGRCYKHYYVPKKPRTNGAEIAGGRVAKKKPESRVARLTRYNGGARPKEMPGVATLCISETQIDRMFLAWPLEDKMGCVQAWLDRAEG